MAKDTHPGKKMNTSMNCRYISKNLRLYHLSLIQFMRTGCSCKERIQINTGSSITQKNSTQMGFPVNHGDSPAPPGSRRRRWLQTVSASTLGHRRSCCCSPSPPSPVAKSASEEVMRNLRVTIERGRRWGDLLTEAIRAPHCISKLEHLLMPSFSAIN